jgi:dTDP-4-dehydrorhamnose 3,5-epimerase/GDP-mannose 4,6 dehydratase
VKVALITGISGQDGAYLAKLLLQKGYRVVGTSRDAEIARFTNLERLGVRDGIKLESAALNDFRSVIQVLSKVQLDEIYNFQEACSDLVCRENVADVTFVQDNQSFSTKKGTLRGLHFRRPARAQGKLIRVLQGKIPEVAVEIRCGSPTDDRHVSVRPEAKEGSQLWIPAAAR